MKRLIGAAIAAVALLTTAPAFAANDTIAKVRADMAIEAKAEAARNTAQAKVDAEQNARLQAVEVRLQAQTSPPATTTPPPVPTAPAPTPAPSAANIPAGSDLGARIKAAKAGDVLLLATGNYPAFSLSGANFTPPVTIASADPARPAVIPSFEISRSGGLEFRDLELATLPGPGLWEFKLFDSHDITLRRVNVHGSLDGNPRNDREGVAVFGCGNCSIVDSTFTELVRAIAAGPSQDPAFNRARNKNLRIEGNKLSLLQVTGMMLSGLDGGVVRGNYLTNFQANMTGDAGSDHPDGIQFMTNTGDLAIPSSNVLVDSNLIVRGPGNVGMQGIFVAADVANYLTGFTVSDNLLIHSGFNGIALFQAKDAVVSGNVAISRDGDQLKTWFIAQYSDGLMVKDNTAIIVSFKPTDGNTRVTETGSVVNAPITDPATLAKIEADWRVKHPDVPR